MKGARCKQRKGAGVQRKTQAEQEQEQEHEHDEQPQPQRQALTRFETMACLLSATAFPERRIVDGSGTARTHTSSRFRCAGRPSELASLETRLELALLGGGKIMTSTKLRPGEDSQGYCTGHRRDERLT